MKRARTSNLKRRLMELCGVPAVLVAGVACNRSTPDKSKPAPPPPSEKVPDAPGPDNTIKSMPPPSDKSAPSQPSTPKPEGG